MWIRGEDITPYQKANEVDGLFCFDYLFNFICLFVSLIIFILFI